MFEFGGGKTSKQPQSLCLCASSAMSRCGWAKALQASPFWLPAICRPSHSRSRAALGALHEQPKLRLKLEVARQARITSLCASVRPVPWADQAKKQLSRLASSGRQLFADVRILGAGLRKEPGTHPPFPGNVRSL